MIAIQIPHTIRVHVGHFHWCDGRQSFTAEFHVHIPEDTSQPASRSWRENLLTIQLMVAWEELLNKGYRNVKYKPLHPHPVF